MFISNLTHFLDKQGHISKKMYQEGREMASFLALIVDTATRNYEMPIMATEIRCIKKRCVGTVEIGFDTETDVIEWGCSHCDEAGMISGWQKTKWDNRV